MKWVEGFPISHSIYTILNFLCHTHIYYVLLTKDVTILRVHCTVHHLLHNTSVGGR